MNCDSILVRYGEVGLKSDSVRARYERMLVRNLSVALERNGIQFEKIERDWGRIFIGSKDLNAAKVAAKVFGVVSASPAISCEPKLGDVSKVAVEVAGEVIREGEKFAVRPRKAGAQEFSTQKIGEVVGAAICESLASRKPKVDLSEPDREIHVEIRQKRAYVFTEIFDGVGGLPYGTQGRVVALISGGIDSPVAAWLMMKRGCEVIPVYMNNTPFLDEAAQRRAFEVMKVLGVWAPKAIKVYEVPHGENLTEITKKCSVRYTCVLCKRMMYRIAIGIAVREKAHAVVTGSSLGQVASQTSANMLAEAYGLGFPIVHPLIGLDKTEITDMAKRIGTYDVSIMQTGSCKAVPRHPATEAKVEVLQEEESKIDFDALVKKSLEGARVSRTGE
jgi:thiamine biosynthesis protein ThiI